ncbi:putative protease AXL1 [Candida viswanathii]|uniref:Putative protease AXL1 n=1 Tax=Candida viswanathii TaxID=5486 RepID=A0A367YKA4_9ASCO|nr:putative protease AXL1 [Candida viswanathii]
MDFFSATTLQTEFKKSLINHHKSYKLIKLSNGLRTLIISDPVATNSSCSISINSGSFNDPLDMQGLAHLCEHMVFMGSSKFPSANEFFNVLNSLGGNTNAFTMGYMTCFYFEIVMNAVEIDKELGFNRILHIFSELFKTPLFNEDHLMNEINAVNDEHLLNMVNDDKVLYHGLRLLANENHPFSRFGTGNKMTLLENRKKLRLEVVRYFQNNFYSENMTLVMKSNLSLNQLQKLVIAHFLDIPKLSRQSKRLSLKSLTKRKSTASVMSDTTMQVFTEFNKVLFIKRDKVKKLRLVLPLGERNTYYESMWCNLIGDESKGSLCSYLKGNKLIESMFTFTQTLSRSQNTLLIDLQVNDLSKANIIIEAIWEFINQLLQTDKQVLLQCMDEYSRTFKYNSYFQQDESSSMDEVSNLSELLMMEEVPAQDILLGNHYQMQGNVHDFVYQTRKIFDKTKLNVIILAEQLPKQYTNQPSTIVKDPYYSFEYQILDFITYPIKQPLPSFFILQSNQFISLSHEQLDKLIEASKTTPPYIPDKQNPQPKLLDYSKNHELWISEHEATDVMITSSIQVVLPKNTVTNCICMEMIVEKLGQVMYPEFYPGELALFSWGIYPNYGVTPSLTISIRGPTVGYLVFVTRFITRVNEILLHSIRLLSYKDFVGLKNKLRLDYEGIQTGDSLRQVLAGSTLLLEHGIWTIEERIDALELMDTSTLAMVLKMIEMDFKLTKILISGNIDHDFVFDISKIINRLTNHLKIYLEFPIFPQPSSILLKSGRSYNLTVKNSNKQDSNDVVYHYIQICQRQDEFSRTLAHFLAFLMSHDIMYKLRTKKQIGYIVLSGVRYNKQTIGIYIYVSSSTYTYDEIMREINQFLFEWELELISMTRYELAENIKLFIESLDNTADGLPSNILFDTPPSVHSDNFTSSTSFDLHKNYFEKIITKNYRFENTRGVEDVNRSWIEAIDLDKLIKFFQFTISIKSSLRSTLSIFVSSVLGRSILETNESRQQISELLLQNNYHLTTLQIENLLIDAGNDVLKIIKKLQSAGYNIQLPKPAKPSKFAMLLLRRSDAGNSVAKLQSVAVQKFGKLYSNNEVTIVPSDVQSKQLIHSESTQLVVNNNGCLSFLEKFSPQDDETIDDLDMLLY